MANFSNKWSNQYCSVPRCKTYRTKDMSLFFFPKDEKFRKTWAQVLKIQKPVTKSMMVCAQHFETQDFFPITERTKRKRIKKGVIPTRNLPTDFHDELSTSVESNDGSGSTQSRFPTNVLQHQAWKDICNFEQSDDLSRGFICGKHFTEDDFFTANTNTGRSPLKPGVYPSVDVPKPGKIPAPLPIITTQNSSFIKIIPQPILPKPILPITNISKVFSSIKPSQTTLPFETVIITPITNTSIVKIEVEESDENGPMEAIQNSQNSFFRNIKNEDISITEWEYSDTYKEITAENLDNESKDLPISIKEHFAGVKNMENMEEADTNSDSSSLDSSDSESFDEEASDKSLLYQSKFAHARFIGDIRPEHFSTPKRTEITLRLIREKYKEQSLKIKKYQQNIRRLDGKIKRLQDLVMQLNHEKLMELGATRSTTDPMDSYSNDDSPKTNKSDRLFDITSVHSYAKTEDSTKPTNLRKCVASGCDKEFPTIPLLRNHIKAEHKGTYLYICIHCARGFNNLVLLNSHEKLHKEILKCDKCGKEFNIPRELLIHNQQEHRNEIFYCCHCGKSFRKTQACKQHELIHNDTKPFNCSECKKSFHTKYLMNRHIKFRHLGQKNFACTVCNKRFTTKGSLKIHAKIHMEEEWPSESEMQECEEK